MIAAARVLIAKKAHEIEPWDNVLISDDRGGALVRKVYAVGEEAIPSEVFIVWDTERWNETVERTIPADRTVFVFPRPEPEYYRNDD